MSDLTTLKRLINPSATVSGEIIAKDDTTMTVSTSQGPQVVSLNSAYKVGDNVLLRNGELAGTLTNPAELPVYYV